MVLGGMTRFALASFAFTERCFAVKLQSTEIETTRIVETLFPLVLCNPDRIRLGKSGDKNRNDAVVFETKCSHLRHSPENLAERTGLEPARENSRRFSKQLRLPFRHLSEIEKSLERVIGIEPMNTGFADLSLNPFGDTRESIEFKI